MRQWLAVDAFDDLFNQFEHTAFRLEVQPRYGVDAEQESLARFAAGQPLTPPEVPFYREYLDFVRMQTGNGRRIERVRVHQEPPTDYQRWERWAGGWNVDAGEHIRYMTVERAAQVGLPIDRDWWLFDSRRVFEMVFDVDLVLQGGYLITDPVEVVNHCAWRDLAVHYSAPDSGAVTT